MKRQEDIEIFVRDCTHREIFDWVESTIGLLGLPQYTGEAVIYASLIGPVVITQMEGDFTSLWFNTSKSPWSTDLDCARQAARELTRVVRCDPGQYYVKVRPQNDILLEIDGNDESLVTIE